MEDTKSILERTVVGGDLSALTSEERTRYYAAVCQSVGLNPLTNPFQYITLQGRLTLYATKNATEQLCAIHGISVSILAAEMIDDDLYVVRSRAEQGDRYADATGAVAMTMRGRDGQEYPAKGESRANLIMKAETKAVRRAVLRLVGLGMLDETEVESARGAGADMGRQPKAIADQSPAEMIIRDMVNRAISELGLAAEEVLPLLGVERLSEILDTDAAWETLQAESAARRVAAGQEPLLPRERMEH